MAKPNFKSNKKKTGLLTHMDIMKGFTSMNNMQDLWTIQPLQCIPLAEKGQDWIKWNANWHEAMALKELPKKAKRLQKLYNLAAGVINRGDYTYNPGENDVSNHLNVAGVADTEQTLDLQFFPIVPNIIQVFLGEQIKRDKAVIVTADDPESQSEALEYKEKLIRQILEQQAVMEKQQTLIQMGILPDNPETQQQFQQEMSTAQQLIETQTRFKKYRTIAEQWAQAFIEKFGAKHYMDELEIWLFADSLIADEAIVALTLREDDFTVESLRPLSTYVNISPNVRYYSKANSITNIEFMSLPDIINTFRNDLKEDQIKALERLHYDRMSSNIIIEGQDRSDQIYDTSKSYDWNAQWSLDMRKQVSADTVREFLTNSGSSHSDTWANNFGNTRLIRVTKVWWPSQRKIGKLTKIEAGNPEPIISLVDENFLFTDKPVYDNSLLKENSPKNLIKGEHIDWTWVTEWRYVVKIGQNIPYLYKMASTEDDFENIYLYGEPCRFQFKGDTNPYDSKPPVEGCRFSNLNTPSISLVETIKPWQILYNALNNKVVKLMPHDYGKLLVMPDSMIKRNSLLQEDGLEPIFEAMDSARETKVLNLDDSREAAIGTNGRFIEPRMVDMSTIEQAALHLQTAQFVKGQAFESIGVSPQRLADVGKSESATGVQAAVDGSVNQTEMRFELFSTHFMPRVWQIIIEAGQYYTSQSDEFSDMYLTSNVEREFFNVLKTDLMLRDLFVSPKSKADVRQLMKDLKTLTMQDNTMGATFLDKVKTFMSKSPSEIIEKLNEAETQRQQTEQDKFQQEQAQQKQLEEQKMALEKEAMEREDQRFNAKLAVDKYLGELKADIGSQEPDTSTQDAFNQQKLMQDRDVNDSKNQLEARKQSLNEQQSRESNSIEREKLAQKQRDNQTKENIAVQNKSFADLKFQQMQRNKAAKK